MPQVVIWLSISTMVNFWHVPCSVLHCQQCSCGWDVVGRFVHDSQVSSQILSLSCGDLSPWLWGVSQYEQLLLLGYMKLYFNFSCCADIPGGPILAMLVGRGQSISQHTLNYLPLHFGNVNYISCWVSHWTLQLFKVLVLTDNCWYLLVSTWMFPLSLHPLWTFLHLPSPRPTPVPPVDSRSPMSEGTPENDTLSSRLNDGLLSGTPGEILQFDWLVLVPLQGIYPLRQLGSLNLCVCIWRGE